MSDERPELDWIEEAIAGDDSYEPSYPYDRERFEQQHEKEIEYLEDELLPALEDSLDDEYAIQYRRDEVLSKVEKIGGVPGCDADGEPVYDLPYSVLGAPGGPYAFFQYFIVKTGENPEEDEWSAAIDAELYQVCCNDGDIAEDLQSFVASWNELELMDEFEEHLYLPDSGEIEVSYTRSA